VGGKYRWRQADFLDVPFDAGPWAVSMSRQIHEFLHRDREQGIEAESLGYVPDDLSHLVEGLAKYLYPAKA
jgi:hypothetical protein